MRGSGSCEALRHGTVIMVMLTMQLDTNQKKRGNYRCETIEKYRFEGEIKREDENVAETHIKG